MSHDDKRGFQHKIIIYDTSLNTDLPTKPKNPVQSVHDYRAYLRNLEVWPLKTSTFLGNSLGLYYLKTRVNAAQRKQYDSSHLPSLQLVFLRQL
jgi:hypothetical protein